MPKQREVCVEAIDKTTQAVGLMNHFWLILFSDDDLREAAGLKYISHMGDDQPYWYLWHTERTGVYELELCGAQAVYNYDWVGEFIIKYYPGVDESWSDGLSFMEKIYRKSEIFQTLPSAGGGCPCHSISHNSDDHRFADLAEATGAPSYIRRSILPADFFYAGHLYIAFKEATGSIIRLKTQTSWQVVITKDHAIKDEKGQSIGFFSKGVVDRNYAGLDISDFIYQRIVKSWSLFHQYQVQHPQLWKGKGFRFLNDGQDVTKDASHNIERIISQTEMTYRPEEVMAFLPDSDLQEMHMEN